MEAIILAGGKAERLATAASGRPKALVPVVGRPLAAYQLALLRGAGVERVIVSCAAGQEGLFESELSGLGMEVVTAPEPERLGRGGGLRFAARARAEEGDVFALNGDELIDVDLSALLDRHRETGAAATIVVAPLPPKVIEPRSRFWIEVSESGLMMRAVAVAFCVALAASVWAAVATPASERG